MRGGSAATPPGLLTIVKRLADSLDELDRLRASLDEVQRQMRQLAYITDAAGELGYPDPLAPLYRDFELRFRGSEEAIRERQLKWLNLLTPLFGDNRLPVVDVGPGRGEWLQLLASRGLVSLGVELNHEMAERSREQGLQVVEADIVSWLQDREDESVAFYTAFQVIEHISTQQLATMLKEMTRTLAPGGGLAVETLNATSFSAYPWFYLDPTHRRFVHFETVKWMAEAFGLINATVHFAEPPPRLNLTSQVGIAIDDVLNGPIDYLMVATKPR